MTHFIDYGPDWPPPLDDKPSAPKRRKRLPLWKRCALWIVIYVGLAAAGLLVVHVLQLDTLRLGPDGPPTTYATTTVHPSPDPAKVTGHP